jgi:phosphomannomutase
MRTAPDPDVVAAVFKAYDVRGLVPQQIDEGLARATGNAFVQVVLGDREDGVSLDRRVVVGHDMRETSPGLAREFAAGAQDAGADVVLVGLASTDQLYFASGSLDVPGAMFTASHNPAAYNGIKLCRAGAAPVGQQTGLGEIRDLVASGSYRETSPRGSLSEQDVLEAYADHLLDLAPVRGRRLRVVVDAGNGMAGHTAPAVLGRLDLDVLPLYYELDGTFPNHEANPIDPANLRDLQAAVRAESADVGLAFDGDADRCFLVDERGEAVDPSAVTALIASRELLRHPGATIIHNLITSRAVPEIVQERGGVPVRTRVGHSYIKATMAESDAVFGGEHSGHFYFRDFWRADSGMLAALHALAALAEQERPLSALLAEYTRYVSSGEVNTEVPDQAVAVDHVLATVGSEAGVEVDRLDGLTFTHRDWWFNLRASNTEPLLRLNVEAADEPTMVAVRDRVLSMIRNQEAS